MSTALVTCPGCGAKLRVPLRSGSTKFRCPKCQTIGRYVPREPASAAASASGESEAMVSGSASLEEIFGQAPEHPVLPQATTARQGRASRGAARSGGATNRTWLYAGLATGGVALLLLVGTTVWLLWPSESGGEPTVPTHAAQASAATQPPAPQQPQRQPEPSIQPLAPKALGWYVEYLPEQTEFLFAVKPAVLLKSTAFRKALAPVSLVWQTLVLQMQQELGVPPDQIQDFVVAVARAPGAGDSNSGHILLLATRSNIPVPEEKVRENAEAVKYGGTTYYRMATPVPNDAVAAVGPAAAMFRQQTLATWLLDGSTLVSGSEEWIRALINGKRAQQPLPNDLLMALGGAEGVGEATLLLAVRFGPEMLKLFSQAGQQAQPAQAQAGAAPAAQGSPPGGSPGGATQPQSGVFPGQGVPGGMPGLGGVGPQLALSPDAIRAGVLAAKATDIFGFQLAVFCKDEAVAGQLQLQLGSIKMLIPGLEQQLAQLRQPQQAVAAAATDGAPTGEQAAGNGSQGTDPRVVAALEALRKAIDGMEITVKGKLVLASMDLAPEAISGLLVALMKQSAERAATASQSQAAPGPPQGTGPSPGGAASGFPGSTAPAPGFPGGSGFPKDKPSEPRAPE